MVTDPLVRNGGESPRPRTFGPYGASVTEIGVTTRAGECATPYCARTPAWPSVRRSLTWCQRCLAGLAATRGYTPVEPLSGPRARWLLRHNACGVVRHTNLASVRRAEPVCPHCRWTAWATTAREDVRRFWAPGLTAAVAAGDTAGAHELAEAFVTRYVWPAERVREVFASVDADLIDEPADGDGLDPLSWACGRCGWVDATPPERMLGEASASWLVCHACDQQRLHHDPAPLARYFSTRGLILLSTVAADRSVAYDATCARCGAQRRVSVQTLTSGAPACLRCDGQHLDPAAPHRVYLFAFDALQAVKVGLTHCADDTRLRQHTAAGGRLLGCVQVTDRAAAALLERVVLERYAASPAHGVASAHFPQGGWTECWDAAAGVPDLAALAGELGVLVASG